MPSTSVKLTPGVNSVKTPSLNEAGIYASNLIRFREGLVEKLGGWSRYFATAVAGIPRALWAWRDLQNTVFVATGTTTNLFVIENNIKTDITPRSLTSTSGITIISGGNGSTTGAGGTILFVSPVVTDPNYVPMVGEVVNFLDIFAINGFSVYGQMTVQTVTGSSSAGFIPPYSYLGSISNKGQFANNSQVSTVNFPSYATTVSSSIVTVTMTAHNLAVGTKYVITNQVSVGGLTLVGFQTVATVIDANNFTINYDAAATSTASATGSGGNVQILYNNSNPYGTTLKGTQITSRDWSLGNYGQILIACAYQSYIYQWQTTGPNQTATIVPNSPLASGIIISDASQQIIAYGGNSLLGFDPNYVAWCDTGNLSTWTAAVGNQAGSYSIPTGSGVIGAATVASNVIMLWTDVDAWAMQYVGYPIVYGFTKLAVGCGLIAQFAWTKFGTYTIWMSQKRFWVYDGSSVQPLDCPIYDNVFPLISAANAWKIRGGTNSQFNEVYFDFPSTAGSGENDTRVVFNPIEGAWNMHAMARSAWVDQSIAGSPLGASPVTSLIYQHETSPDADGAAMTPSFTTGYFQVSEGEDIIFTDWMRPDFNFPTGVGTVQVTIYTRNYVGDTPTVAGPFSFTAVTEYINFRCRGRYIALQFSSSDTGSFWRAGRPQVRFAPAGRR